MVESATLFTILEGFNAVTFLFPRFQADSFLCPWFEAVSFQFYDYSRLSTTPSGSRPILSSNHAFLRPIFASEVTYGSVRLLPVPD